MAKQRSMYGKDDLYVTDRSSPNATRVTDVQKWRTNQDDIRHLPGALPIQRLAIQDGAISPSAAFVVVDTEGGAPADDLTTINPGDLHDGMEIELSGADSSRVVTIKNGTAFSGIRTINGGDLVLGTNSLLRVKLISTESITYWKEIPAAVKISDNVQLGDSTTAASSKAVKTAYDRGSAGIIAAETAQSTAETAQSTAETAQSTAETAQYGITKLREDVPSIAAYAAGPSAKFINLTEASFPFTAPETGWIRAICTATTGSRSFMLETSIFVVNSSLSSSSGQSFNAIIPVTKGQKVNLYLDTYRFDAAYFVYANGAVPA